jgi:hypothetical protein
MKGKSMRHAKEIYLSNKTAILLYCDPKSKDKNNYAVVKNESNKNTFVEKNLDKDTAKKIFDQTVASL